MKLTIGYLYGDLMNMYGDTGNIIALKKRSEWRDIDVTVKNISVGDSLKAGEIDIYFFGGGQDQQQELVAKDLQAGKGKVIKQDVEAGVPLLSICGGYQLLGAYYTPHNGSKLPGVELFPVYTQASHKRMIGNIVIEVDSSTTPASPRGELREYLLSNPAKRENRSSTMLVGFENHSGQTFLKEGGTPLGKIISGFGNNGQDQTEGCVYKNAIGCYMHGSLLPKNPHLTDWLIQKALETKYKKVINLKSLDDSLENTAHNSTIQKFG